MNLYKNKPELQDQNPNVKIKSVKKLSNQEKLVHKAITDSDGFIRRKAVVRIKDENLLAYVAKNATDDLICYNALRRIKTHDILVDVAKNACNASVCSKALEKILDDDIVIDMVNGSNASARSVAINYINDFSISQIDDDLVLADIVKFNLNDTIRHKAVKKINNNNILEDIACTCRNESIGILAINCIDNPDILENILQHGYCTEKITNAALKRLEEIYRKIDDKFNSNEYIYQNPSNKSTKISSLSNNKTKISNNHSNYDKQSLKLGSSDDMPLSKNNKIYDECSIFVRGSYERYEFIDEQLSELPVFIDEFEEFEDYVLVYITENITAIYDADEEGNLKFRKIEIKDEDAFVESYARACCQEEDWEEYTITNNYVYFTEGCCEKRIGLDEIIINFKQDLEKRLLI